MANDIGRQQLRGLKSERWESSKCRKRKLIPLEQAVEVAGTTEWEVRTQCPVVNRNFDAMTYSEEMYSETEMINEADVLTLKAEIDARRRRFSIGGSEAGKPSHPDRSQST